MAGEFESNSGREAILQALPTSTFSHVACRLSVFPDGATVRPGGRPVP